MSADAGVDMTKGKDLLAVLWERKLIQPLWKALWRFLKMLEIDHMIQVCRSWAYNQKTLHLTIEVPAYPCSLAPS